MFHDLYLPPELQDSLRRTCRRVVNYPLNLLDQAHRFEKTAEFCDETFCAEEEALAPLRARFGASKIRYVPLADDPYIHRPVGSPDSPRVLFVGSVYADRLTLLDHCDRELPVSIYGANYNLPGVLRNFASEYLRARKRPEILSALRTIRRVVSRDQRIVGDEEFVRLASKHGISVGFANVRHEQTREMLKKVRLRDYEAPMCGLCHIAARLPELERGFDDRKEILFYDDTAQIPELLAKIRKNEIPWHEIGQKARVRAEVEHTWTKRLGAVFA
jgi:spore maturation protein CgeB